MRVELFRKIRARRRVGEEWFRTENGRYHPESMIKRRTRRSRWGGEREIGRYCVENLGTDHHRDVERRSIAASTMHKACRYRSDPPRAGAVAGLALMVSYWDFAHTVKSLRKMHHQKRLHERKMIMNLKSELKLCKFITVIDFTSVVDLLWNSLVSYPNRNGRTKFKQPIEVKQLSFTTHLHICEDQLLFFLKNTSPAR